MLDPQFLQQVISLTKENAKIGGRPFGAVVVSNGKVFASLP